MCRCRNRARHQHDIRRPAPGRQSSLSRFGLSSNVSTIETPARPARGARRLSRTRSVSAATIVPVPHHGGERQRLAPAPAQRSTTVIPGCACAAAVTIWLPASCTSSRPANGSTLILAGKRNASGRPAIGTASGNSAMIASGSARSRLTRTSSGALHQRQALRRAGPDVPPATRVRLRPQPPARPRRLGKGRAVIRRTHSPAPHPAPPAKALRRARKPEPRRMPGSRRRPDRAPRAGPSIRHSAASRNSVVRSYPPPPHLPALRRARGRSPRSPPVSVRRSHRVG